MLYTVIQIETLNKKHGKLKLSLIVETGLLIFKYISKGRRTRTCCRIFMLFYGPENPSTVCMNLGTHLSIMHKALPILDARLSFPLIVKFCVVTAREIIFIGEVISVPIVGKYLCNFVAIDKIYTHPSHPRPLSRFIWQWEKNWREELICTMCRKTLTCLAELKENEYNDPITST